MDKIMEFGKKHALVLVGISGALIGAGLTLVGTHLAGKPEEFTVWGQEFIIGSDGVPEPVGSGLDL